MGNFQQIYFASKEIKKTTQLVVFLFFSINAFSQENTSINEVLNGFWQINKNQEFILICNDGKEYYYKKNNNIESINYTSYLFYKKNLPFQHLNQNNYSRGFMEKDRLFDFIDEEEVVKVVFFKEKNIIFDSLKIYTSVFLKFFKIDFNSIEIVESKQYPNINYYDRVRSPSKELLNFFKKIAPEKIKKISCKKSNIYFSTNVDNPAKMYLIKGDEVILIKEKDQWIKIRYYGKKPIEGWIKKSDINNP